MDEAQTQGRDEDILVTMTMHRADLLSVGDPVQPIGASPMKSMQRLLDYVDQANLGIRQPGIRFLDPQDLLTEAQQYCDEKGTGAPGSLEDLLLMIANLQPLPA